MRLDFTATFYFCAIPFYDTPNHLATCCYCFAFLGLNKYSWYSPIAVFFLIQSLSLKYINNYYLAVGQKNQHPHAQIVCRLSFSSKEEIALRALSFTFLSFLLVSWQRQILLDCVL